MSAKPTTAYSAPAAVIVVGERARPIQSSGSDLLTGGPFGVESSLTVLVVGLGVAFALARRVVRSGQVLPPLWSRAREQAAEAVEQNP